MELRSGEEIELRGLIRNYPTDSPLKIDILSGPQEFLPPGISIKEASILDGQQGEVPVVWICLKNESDISARIRSKDVLATLHWQSTNDDDTCDQPIMDSLVGPACETNALINGVVCQALLDSGSQVTTLSRSFYQEHLADSVPLEDIGDSGFSVEGAGGQLVYFDGFIRIGVKFPKHVVGTDSEVQTFALVCADTNYSNRTPMIVGTNTFRCLEMNCKAGNGTQFLKNLPVRLEVAYAYKDTLVTSDGRVGKVKICSKRQVKIPPGTIKELKGICKAMLPHTRDALLLQGGPENNLPVGVAIVNSLVPIHERNNKFKVAIHNKTCQEVIINPKNVSATLYTTQSETPICAAQKNIQEFFSSVPRTHVPIIDFFSQNGIKSNPQCRSMSSSRQSEENPPGIDMSEVFEFNFGDSSLPEDTKKRIRDRLQTYGDVFSRHEYDVGKTDAMEHEIKLTDGPYIREKPRPIPAKDFEDARQHIQALLDAEIIKPSSSPYASPIVLVRKKNGKLRLCIDYRKVNSRTIRDSYPIPKISEIFTALHGAQWFTTMDLKMGFHQIPMAESSKDITAFTCPFGLYQFERMSQGLKNSPLTFQRLMDKCVGDMNMKELLVYLDDLIVHGRSVEEAEERLFKTLDRLRSFNLKLDPKKCMFFQSSVKHLGHIVSAEGVKPDPDKISALTTWPKPKTLQDLKSFLGFTGYFRDYVKNYSQIVKPLNKLTNGYIPQKTIRRLKAKGKKPKPTLTMNSDITGLWTDECQNAFDTIISKLTSEPVLGFADLSSPFILHTDASNIGLGACLYQKQGEQIKVIAYGSRGLSKSELNYPAHKKEFLALKWAVTDKFHDYLYGGKFTAVTDNNPLTYVLTSAKLDATGYRWLAALSVYDFDLKYRRGLNHNDADGLSRRPQDAPSSDKEYENTMDSIAWLVSRTNKIENLSNAEDLVTMNSASVDAVVTSHGIHVTKANKKTSEVPHINIMTPTEGPLACHSNTPVWVECLATSTNAVPDSLDLPSSIPGQAPLETIDKEEWHELQGNDPEIKKIIELLHDGKKPSTKKVAGASPELKIYLREFTKLRVIDGVLFRWVTDEKGMAWQQLVLPRSHRLRAIVGLHDEVSHAGLQTTLRLARQRFFWPYMASNIETHIDSCERCFRRKAKPQKAPMESIKTSFPLQLVCIDFLSLEPDAKGIKDILVITDHFTKYALAVPTKNQTAKVVAETLWDNLISHYGWPEKLHSDQGADFQSKVIAELCRLGNVKKTRTTPYHPQGNPVERFNHTLLGMLGTLHQSQKKDWRMYVKPLTHAYNCTVNETTGYSPYYLMFGRHARLPIDILFGTDPDARRSPSSGQYVKDLKLRLQHAFDVARENSSKSAAKNKKRYDKSVCAVPLERGDRVLVKNVNIRGKHKLADRWEKDVYIIQSKIPDIPVYVVTRENGEGSTRTLHRNLLLPCGSLVVDLEPEPAAKPRKIKTRSQSKQNRGNDSASSDQDSDSDTADIEFGSIPPLDIRYTTDKKLVTDLCPDVPEFQPRTEPAVRDLQRRDDQHLSPDTCSDQGGNDSCSLQDTINTDACSLQDFTTSCSKQGQPLLELPPPNDNSEENTKAKSAVEETSSIILHDDTEANTSQTEPKLYFEPIVSPLVDDHNVGQSASDAPQEKVETVTCTSTEETPALDEPEHGTDQMDSTTNIQSKENTEVIVDESDRYPSDTRRSGRVRQPPARMTFDTLGKPTAHRYDMHLPRQAECLKWALSSIMQRELETGSMLLTSSERDAMLKAIFL